MTLLELFVKASAPAPIAQVTATATIVNAIPKKKTKKKTK